MDALESNPYMCECTGKVRQCIAELKLNYILSTIMLNAKTRCSKHKSSVKSRRVVPENSRTLLIKIYFMYLGVI
jgi:hypothetical protein